MKGEQGAPVALSTVESIDQEAEIWQGVLKSDFSLHGEPVSVQTTVHPDRDQISAVVNSELLNEGELAILEIRLDSKPEEIELSGEAIDYEYA